MTTLAPFPRLAAHPVIATCAFILDSPPVSLNAAYATQAIRKRGKPNEWTARFYMTTEAENRKTLIRHAAEFAKRTYSRWPADLWAVDHVRLSIYAFNVKGDAGNEVKLVADAAEGVLYWNDRVVSIGEIPKPEKDATGKPRVEYVFDLIGARTPLEARLTEIAAHKRRAAYLTKIVRATKTGPSERVCAQAELQDVQAARKAAQAKASALLAEPADSGQERTLP